MSITRNNNYIITSTKRIVMTKFDMKDLGVANVIPEIKIVRTSKRLSCHNHIM